MNRLFYRPDVDFPYITSLKESTVSTYVHEVRSIDSSIKKLTDVQEFLYSLMQELKNVAFIHAGGSHIVADASANFYLKQNEELAGGFSRKRGLAIDKLTFCLKFAYREPILRAAVYLHGLKQQGAKTSLADTPTLDETQRALAQL